MKTSETCTENIFREFYGVSTFIEKSAISTEYGFISKNNTNNQGYPDFFREEEDFVIIVEAKSKDIEQANSDVLFMLKIIK